MYLEESVIACECVGSSCAVIRQYTLHNNKVLLAQQDAVPLDLRVQVYSVRSTHFG